MKLATGVLLVLVAGMGIHRAQQGVRSTTFAGPGFHARNPDDGAAVNAAFSRHIEQMGFKKSPSPSGFDSWAGVHSEGEKRSWYVKSDSRHQKTYVDVALDRNYRTNHRIFFTYVRNVDADTAALAVASAVLDEDAGTLSNVSTLLQTVPVTKRAGSQVGARIAIDPKDGNLFVSIGDRSTGDPIPLQAQQRDTYLGKIVHITPEGKAAPGNPSLGLPEIWSMAHRTPQGLAFAPDGRLWETEHGPRGGDELNLIERGKNYGWPIIVHGINYPGTKIGEGIVEKEGLGQPRYYWDPIIAPSGLAFYQGNLFPRWRTSVLVGGLAGRAILRLELGKDDKVVNEEPLLRDLNERIRDVRVFQDGAVYVLTDSENGKLLKLTPAAQTSASRP